MVSGRLTYRPALPDDVKAIVKLSDINFGKAYLSTENINLFVEHTETAVYVAENKKALIGFGIFHLIMQWEIINYLGNSLGNKFVNFNPQDRIFLIKSLAIKPEYRRKGIGKNLVRKAMKEKFSGDQLLSIVWESKENTAMEKLCKSLGMKFWYKAENFWLMDSSEKNYNCPVCGNPCMCNALIYKKTNAYLNAV